MVVRETLMPSEVNDTFMLFTLVFIWFLTASCFTYSIYKFITVENRTFVRYTRIFFLAWMTSVYGMMLWGHIPMYTEMSAILARFGAMGLISLIFVDTYKV